MTTQVQQQQLYTRPILDKFNGEPESWPEFSIRILQRAEELGVKDYLEKEYPERSTTNQSLANTLIIDHIGRGLLPVISQLPTAFEKWTYLIQLYDDSKTSNILSWLQELSSLHYPSDGNIIDIGHKIQTISSKLTSVGRTITKDEKFAYLLSALPAQLSLHAATLHDSKMTFAQITQFLETQNNMFQKKMDREQNQSPANNAAFYNSKDTNRDGTTTPNSKENKQVAELHQLHQHTQQWQSRQENVKDSLSPHHRNSVHRNNRHPSGQHYQKPETHETQNNHNQQHFNHNETQPNYSGQHRNLNSSETKFNPLNRNFTNQTNPNHYSHPHQPINQHFQTEQNPTLQRQQYPHQQPPQFSGQHNGPYPHPQIYNQQGPLIASPYFSYHQMPAPYQDLQPPRPHDPSQWHPYPGYFHHGHFYQPQNSMVPLAPPTIPPPQNRIHWRQRLQTGNQPPDRVCIAMSMLNVSSADQDQIYVDSCASHHYTGFRHLLSDYKPLNEVVGTATRATSKVVGMGTLTIQTYSGTIKIVNVRYAPQMEVTLLSLGRLQSRREFRTIFDDEDGEDKLFLLDKV